LQLKRFEGITEANIYYNKIKENASAITIGTGLQTVNFYIIAPSNFKWIKQPADLDKYATFFKNNYTK
jgi:hypothetical protein